MHRQTKAALTLALCVLAAGCGSGREEASRTSGASASATTTSPPAPVEVAGLDGLLLSPEQINAAMGAAKMALSETPTAMADDAAKLSDPACLPLYNPVEVSVYPAQSAFREQQLKDPGSISSEVNGHIMVADFDHFADQAVVRFPSAGDAQAFFTASVQNWPACADRSFNVTQPNWPVAVFTVGPVTHSDNMLSGAETVGPQTDWMWEICRRALTVVNNIAVDVATCTKDKSDTQANSAIDIAHQIAAKVPVG